MSRPLRVEYAGAFYHVLNRGNAGEKVLRRDRDKEKFLQYAADAARHYGMNIHTYCLMDNHFHMIVETRDVNLSAAMQWLNISYAAWYNRKHSRSGHVFQGRFKSYLIEADEYLTTVSRYIHLNPVRAGVVEKPADYLWSSYRSFTGGQKAPAWLETGKVLEQFSSKQSAAFKAYKSFVEDIKIEELENPGKGAREGFIIGSDVFADWVQTRMLAGRRHEKEIPQLKRLTPKPGVDNVIEAVAKEFGCSTQELIISGKKRNLARDTAIYIARTATGMSCTELGKRFGGITGAGITMKFRQIKALLGQDKRLAGKIANINNRIFNN
jgi:REP element-mobilizing transposase RayT